MARAYSAILSTTVTDPHTRETVTMPRVRVRWSLDNRTQCAILAREGERARDRAAGAMGWLSDTLNSETTVVRSGPSRIV